MSDSKYTRITYYVHNTEFKLFQYCENNTDGITRVLLKDSSIDNKQYLQGSNHTIIIDKIDGIDVTYQNINSDMIEELKHLIALLIKREKVSDNVKLFLDDIGGYRLWNLNVLDDIKAY